MLQYNVNLIMCVLMDVAQWRHLACREGGATDFGNESNLHLLGFEFRRSIYTVEADINRLWSAPISLNQPDYGMRDTPPIHVPAEIFDRNGRFAVRMSIIYLARSIWQPRFR